MPVTAGLLSQLLDIQGSINVDNAKTLADEGLSKGPQKSTGTGDSFAVSAGVVTLTDAGATWTSDDIGDFITIAGSTSPANDGTFLIESVPTGTTLTYTNASGVTEAYPGTWTINQPYSLEDDINFERTDRKLIKGTASHTSDVPSMQRPSAVGVDVPRNLTNIRSVDEYARVRDVQQPGITLRPSISETGTGTLGIGDETFSVTDFHFVAGDLNSFITISNSTDADGTYRIKAVTDGQTVELDGLNSLTTESCDWKLEGDLKGILSTRSYADSTDRRGIPIADSGAEDAAAYEATFTDIIDPVVRLGIEEEDGDRIYARSFGNEKDPNRTADNEGTRFFVQLITGTNDGSAVDSDLEIISGRSGSAASLTNGSTNVTGLANMSEADVGRYLTIYNTAVDGNQRHAQITAWVSTTEVTVAGANFATDANDGSIKWQVSRHAGSFDFYHGDRYRLDELSETAGRTTLIGGIVSDASLVQDIGEIREYLGAADGETTPNLTNTGNYFVWSDLTNPLDTSVEECLNELNEQIGNRTYSAAALAEVTGLASGQTITASIEALALAIASSSVTRIIERLSAAIPKQTTHTLPGGATYTVDGTNNGANMSVYWRGLLKDPGSVANNDHYAEVDGGGGTGTQITVFSLIRQNDHVNYFILQ